MASRPSLWVDLSALEPLFLESSGSARAPLQYTYDGSYLHDQRLHLPVLALVLVLTLLPVVQLLLVKQK